MYALASRNRCFRPLVMLSMIGCLLLSAGITRSAAAKDPLEMLGSAQHVIIPQARAFDLHRHGPHHHHHHHPPHGQQPTSVFMTGVEARIDILDRTARTTLEVSLANPLHQQQEAVLLLPVPEDAAVSGFMFEGASSEPTAKILSADEARALYESIVRKLRDPALLEFAGYNLIRSSVFPVPANGTQKIRLTYEHILESAGNRIDYVLPRSESLEQRTPTPWKITASLQSRHPIATVYSPSHELIAERTGPGSFTINLREVAAPEPGPFRLSYLTQHEGVSGSFYAYPDPSIGGGYFLFMAGLPAERDALAEAIKREVTIVIDRSGSMAGGKMDQVKDAALQVIEGLADGEYFNIIDYSNHVSFFAREPMQKNTKTGLAARQYLESIRTSGGTNIHDALLEALRQPATNDTIPIVLFLTDGLPTIGKTRETDIRAMVESGNAHGRRVFTFGVGEDVNVPLLDRIALVTRATSTYVLENEDVEVKVADVFEQLYGPVFAEPTLLVRDRHGNESTRLIRELIPHQLPDLFHNDQLILLGQYVDDEPMQFELSGDFLGGERVFSFDFDPSRATTQHAFVPRLWASRRIAFLVDVIRQAGAFSAEQPAVVGQSLLDHPQYGEIVQEIVRLSTEFGILTEYTSFLATEGTDLSDWDRLVAGCLIELDTKAIRTRSGKAALNQSLNNTMQREQITLKHRNTWLDEDLNQREVTGVQQVCDRAFLKRGDQWIDTRLVTAQAGGNIAITPDEVIAFGSAEHLHLLEQLVRENRQGVLSVGDNILLKLGDRNVLITNEQ